MDIRIKLKDINELGAIDVAAIMTRLSWPDSGSDSSIQKELDKRYFNVQPGPHPKMQLAMIWRNDVFVAWVGTRAWPEKFKGEPITAQTVECFTDPDARRHGFARLGLQALISGGFLDRSKPVSVYAPEVVPMARSCGCQIVIFCESEA
jgi:hypothetical protein